MILDRHAEIAKRAYTMWELEGRPAGKDLDALGPRGGRVRRNTARPNGKRGNTKATASRDEAWIAGARIATWMAEPRSRDETFYTQQLSSPPEKSEVSFGVQF
jgi:hypothetical protein